MRVFSKSDCSPPAVFVLRLLLLATLFLPISAQTGSDLLLKLPSERRENEICPPNSLDICPVKCFRPDPVCGVDGVTYWCGCAEAHCAGARVKKLGFCEVGNGGSAGPAGQALLLLHIIWLVLLGVFVLFGLL
ncbi:uncharacterized protein LOC127244820 isoform X2 [Andrographis paniculata]|uniref:uncharacterized protein LOC127244820 isoform X2 n=1 Tax=Andrographis paniculata TaxID=175694 RepID=UPI0021E9707E|nr:uncharacterized protein LOC127244820 isoform X2 [Andrographis paniculata]